MAQPLCNLTKEGTQRGDEAASKGRLLLLGDFREGQPQVQRALLGAHVQGGTRQVHHALALCTHPGVVTVAAGCPAGMACV